MFGLSPVSRTRLWEKSFDRSNEASEGEEVAEEDESDADDVEGSRGTDIHCDEDGCDGGLTW